MGLKDFFKRDVTEVETEEVDLHLERNEEPAKKFVTVAEALALPAVYSCTELIANTIANLEVKLYKEVDGSVGEVKDDPRTTLLNNDTCNLMTGDELKKAMVRDLLLHGACYVYKNGYAQNIKSLHYVPVRHISILPDELNVIFRDMKIQVQAETYYTNGFVICTKNTEDGVQGIGIVAECNEVLKLVLDNMKYTAQARGNGGVKRGVLQSIRRLTADAIAELKKAWKRLYSGNNDCIVLNEGITYKELQQTGAEMQMIESKTTIDADICKLFNVPVDMFKTSIPDAVWSAYVKLAITPLLDKVEKVLNKSLLGVEEKGKYYFAFDTKQLNKGDIEKRFKAYEIALKNGFMTPSEVCFEEDLNEIETLNFVKFSLGDVLMNIEIGEIYTPNTNTIVYSADTGQNVKGVKKMNLEVRNDGTLEISGYVNVVDRYSKELYGQAGKFIEKVEPQTFQRALDKGQNIDMLLNHDTRRKLADTSSGMLELREDSIDLYARAVINDPEVIVEANKGNLKGGFWF